MTPIRRYWSAMRWLARYAGSVPAAQRAWHARAAMLALDPVDRAADVERDDRPTERWRASL